MARSGTLIASRMLPGPRIARDGSFGLTKRVGKLRFVVRGRFLSRSAASVSYRAGAQPTRTPVLSAAARIEEPSATVMPF